MAILSVTRLPQGHGGEFGIEGNTYTVTYQIEVNSLEDMTLAIMASGQIPILGSLYDFGDSEADGNAVCMKIVINRSGDETRLLWHAICSYETRDLSWPGGGNVNGDPEKDPLKWHDEIDISFSQNTKPVERAVYISGFRGKMKAAFPDNPDVDAEDILLRAMIPINSAGDIFDPPLEADEDVMHIRITRNLEFFPHEAVMRFQNTVNSDQFTINKPAYNFNLTIGRYCAKMNISATFQIENGIKFWRTTINLDVKWDGWRIHVLDRGLHSRKWADDCVEEGQEPVEPGQERCGDPLKKRIVDEDSIPTADPSLLDGDGEPLSEAELKAHDFVYIVYAVYRERSFAEIEWERNE